MSYWNELVAITLDMIRGQGPPPTYTTYETSGSSTTDGGHGQPRDPYDPHNNNNPWNPASGVGRSNGGGEITQVKYSNTCLASIL